MGGGSKRGRLCQTSGKYIIGGYSISSTDSQSLEGPEKSVVSQARLQSASEGHERFVSLVKTHYKVFQRVKTKQKVFQRVKTKQGNFRISQVKVSVLPPSIVKRSNFQEGSGMTLMNQERGLS